LYHSSIFDESTTQSTTQVSGPNLRWKKGFGPGTHEKRCYHVGLEYIGQGSLERAGYIFLLDDDDGPFENHFFPSGDIAELQDVFVKDGDERNEITFQVHLEIYSDDLKPQDSNLGEDLLKFFVEAPGSDLTIVV